MARAISYARTIRQTTEGQIEEIARALIIGGCGLALVLAGPALPF
jgi:hypothetical protein